MATVHGYSIGKREAEPGYGYRSYSSGYNLGNHNYGDNYGYQQHSVHKRSPQIPGLRIFGGGLSAYGGFASAAVGALSGIYGGGALSLGSLSSVIGKKSLLFGKREAEPGYGYRSYSSGYNLGNDDHSYDYGNQQHSVHKRSPQIPGLRFFGTKASGILGKTSLLFGKREAEPGYGYRSYSSGYNLGNDDHSYDYGHQQHSVHKRSPQIPGLRIFGTKASLAGTLGSFGLGGLSARLGTGSLTGLGSFS